MYSLMQYIKCVNCNRLLGEGSLICGLGHTYCVQCKKAGDQCWKCSKTFESRLYPNVELEGILKMCFTRCIHLNCKHLIPISEYEYHINSLHKSKLGCIEGCGVVTRKLGLHLINKHGYNYDYINDADKVKIYSDDQEWVDSKLKESIISNSNLYLLMKPRISNNVFTLELFNLHPNDVSVKVKVKKKWNKLVFKGPVPSIEETLVKISEPTFFNCDLNVIQKNFLQFDSKSFQHYLEIEVIKIGNA
jgi:hypothetical protein